MTLKQWIVPCIVAMLVIGGPGISAAAADYGGAIRIGVTEATSDLLKWNLQEAALLSMSPLGSIRPGLARSWEILDQGRTWRFHMDADVTFHDGSPVVAEHVAEFYRLLKNSNNWNDFEFVQFKQIRAIDNQTVTISFDESLIAAKYLFARLHVYDEDKFLDYSDYGIHRSGNTMAYGQVEIGAGPFSEILGNPKEMTEEQLQAIPEKKYLYAHDKAVSGRPFLDKIIFRNETMNALWRLVQTDEMDLVFGHFGPRDLEVLTSNPDLTIVRLANPSNIMLVSGRTELMNDHRVRKALTLALDREKLVGTVAGGAGEECSGPFAPGAWTIPGRNTYDPRQSKLLLQSAGYRDSNSDGLLDRDGLPLELTVAIEEGDPFQERIFSVVQNQLIELGISVKGKFNKRESDLVLMELSNDSFIASSIWSNPMAAALPFFLLRDFHIDIWDEIYLVSRFKGSFLNDLHMAQTEKQVASAAQAFQKSFQEEIPALCLFQADIYAVFNSRFQWDNPGPDYWPWDVVRYLYLPREMQNAN